MKLSDFVITFLQKKGIRHFFGYQGTMIAHIVDSIERNPETENHSCYHEQAAAFAACGYAQAKKECACAYATSGPGAVNLLSGVADAYYDSLPVIFLTGQLNTYEYSGIKGLRQQGFQETDIVSMAGPITKYAVQIRNPEDIVRELNYAFHVATTGRKGPVLIDLPMDMQRSEVKNPVYDMTFQEEDFDSNQADQAAEAILDSLKAAHRPVILLGHGVDNEPGQRELLRFAQKRQIPIITSVLAKSVLPFDHPLNFGCIGGAYGHRYANMIANAKSDLLICLGISLCTRQIGTKVQEFAKNAKIIRVDIDPYNLQRKIHKDGINEEKFQADASQVIVRLNRACCKEQKNSGEWMAVCNEIKECLQAVDDYTPERYPNRMIGSISDMLEDISAVSIDVGQHMVWSYQSFKNRKGQELLFSGGHGAMGYGLPAAIGAYYATGKPVACICGDGAFQMNIQELEWVKRENIPIKMIIMNNQALGMIRHLQKDYFDGLFAGTTEECGFSSCDFSRVALAYGIPSERIKCDDVQEKAQDFLEGKGPKLLEIMLEPGTFAYPKTCLGEPIHNQQPYIPKDVYEKLMNL
ncbi:MAG: thiamine pyrophosphate-binding protein [Blautia sp.]|nr:thiamine pyrophosphate-binding protein [Blautia sp.]